MAPTRTRTCAGIACMIAYVSACSSWHAVAEPPERVITRDRPSRVRIITEEGKQFIVDPEIRDETLIGTREEGDSVAVALGDIRGLEVLKVSTGKTIAGISLLVGLVVGVALAGGGGVVPIGGFEEK